MTITTRLAVAAMISGAVGLLAVLTSAESIDGASPAASGGLRFLGPGQWEAAAPGTGVWAGEQFRPGRVNPGSRCVSAHLPGGSTVNVRSTGARAVGIQHVTTAAQPSDAKALVAGYPADLRTCWTEKYGQDGRPVRLRKLREFPRILDGLSVFGVTYRDPSAPGARARARPRGAARTSLVAVGRDGRQVTTIELDVRGSLKRAPVPEFTKAARRGLRQLR